MTIWTIGHSTRTLDEFLAVLAAHGIETLVDVRRFPGSRRLPHFGSEALAAALEQHGLAYRWVEPLGGRRHARAGSPNDGWRNDAFRGYADHVATEEFATGLGELLDLAAATRTTIMCAELLWWQCHRRLISDVLTALGHEVRHIRDAGPTERHELTAPARLVDGVLTYAAPERQTELDLG